MKLLQRTRSYAFVCNGSSSVEPVSPNIVSRPSHYLSPLSLLSPAYCTVLPALWLIRVRSLLSLSLLQLPGCSTAGSCCLRVFYIDDVSWAQEEKLCFFVISASDFMLKWSTKFDLNQVFLHILCWLNNTRKCFLCCTTGTSVCCTTVKYNEKYCLNLSSTSSPQPNLKITPSTRHQPLVSCCGLIEQLENISWI